MRRTEPDLTLSQTEIDALLAQVKLHAVSPQTAIQLLIVKGEERARAEEIVRNAALGQVGDAPLPR